MALISTSELAERLGDPKLRLLDARWYLDPARKGIDAYAAGHIRGAFFADLEADFTGPGGARGGPRGRHPFPSHAQIQNVIRLFGITAGVSVVVYDDAAGAMAARVWFVLKTCGFDDCSVLDGGITKWTAEGREITDQPPSISTMTDFVVTPRPELVLSKAEFVAGKDSALVLDARAAERYRGETEPIDPRAGHIPGARSAPYTFNLTSEANPVFRKPAELRAHYESLGVTEGNPPIVYCGSGITATHDLLALEVAGFKGRLYAGSWSEWSSDPALPIATGENP
ncbi:MAG: sulfurtransferase [Vicinamibacteria bacterium]|jgi:thiosulfate/3-mercaptopyruvate sulfurtransferase|nr:sulfurtransferase [Vicinamibacteria bacterium]MBP9945987.1 sulfurtransferase [Vicinamibacteria bacterium]